MDPVLVVGGGISGVACAGALSEAGVPVRVLDRGRRIGGRMASRRLGPGQGRPTDLGASYLTVSDDRFGAVVDRWHDAGLAHPWTDSFAVLGAEAPRTTRGPVRWGARRGLRSLVEALAEGLDVQRQEVARVTRHRDGPAVDGRPAPAVVLAMPDAQAARLLAEDDPARAALTRPWDPVIALAAWWSERTWDLDGAFVNGHPALAWVADDGRRRGDGAPTLVAHSTPDLARGHLADPAAAGPVLVGALRDLLGLGPPLGTHVHRWSLAKPAGERRAPYLLEEGLGVCGDGWGPVSKVEGAYLSGLELGRALAGRLS